MRERPPFRAQGRARRSDLKAHAFRALQIGNDLKKIAGGRIPFGAKHLVKGLYMDFGMSSQPGKADRSIYVITQQLFAECHLAREKAFDGLTKKTLSKGRISFHSCLNRFSKISRQSHFHSSSFCHFFLCL